MSEVAITSDELRVLDPQSAAERLADCTDAEIGTLLSTLFTGHAVEILEEFPPERRSAIAASVASGQGKLWLEGHLYEDSMVGRLMERPPAVFRGDDRVDVVSGVLREIVKRKMVTYIFVTEADGHLIGVVAFRELLFARPDQTMSEIMVPNPFFLRPDQELVDAMREVVTRHYPVYPICEADGRLLGMVKGQVMFEAQTFEISAQAGSMVGVEKEERLATPWPRSLKMRHPWLQLNLLTAFLAAGVVGFFQGTIDKIVVLAIFLPVLAGQSGNTGCQALAVTLRGMTLGELGPDKAVQLVAKEALLGFCNGVLVGLVAGAGMFVYCQMEGNPRAFGLSLIVVGAMAIACVVSGIAGVMIPLTLRRIGADPATASSIFLTTATDCVSMGTFLALATVFLL
jgi:magnesium transporter